MFFTIWGRSVPKLDTSDLDGTNRKTLVSTKIVYPYGITIDLPNQQVYWVDTFLDSIERINYDGSNRRTIYRGVKHRKFQTKEGILQWVVNHVFFWFQMQKLHDITVFENHLYVITWLDNSINVLKKLDTSSHTPIAKNLSKPFALHVYHRQRQPQQGK